MIAELGVFALVLALIVGGANILSYRALTHELQASSEVLREEFGRIAGAVQLVPQPACAERHASRIAECRWGCVPTCARGRRSRPPGPESADPAFGARNHCSSYRPLVACRPVVASCLQTHGMAGLPALPGTADVQESAFLIYEYRISPRQQQDYTVDR